METSSYGEGPARGRGVRPQIVFVAVLVVGALALSGCGIELGIGAGVGGAITGENVQVGLGQLEKTQEKIGGLDGQGRGRIPAVSSNCPDDADALIEVITEHRRSELSGVEMSALEALRRSALSCDPALSERYADWLSD